MIHHAIDEISDNLESALISIDRAIRQIEASELSPCYYQHLSQAYIVKGMVLQNLYRFEEAISLFDKASRIRKEIRGDTIGLSGVYNHLSSVEMARGNYEAAIRASTRAMQLLKNYAGKKESADYWNYLGRSYINAANILVEIDSLPAVDDVPEHLMESRESLVAQLSLSERQNRTNMFISGLFILLTLTIFFLLIRTERERYRRLQQELNSYGQDLDKRFQEKITEILKSYHHDFEERRIRFNGVLHDQICPQIIRIKRELEYFLNKNDKQVIRNAIEFTDKTYEDTRALINGKEILPNEPDWLQNIILLLHRQKRAERFALNDHIDLNPEEISPALGTQLSIIAHVLLDNVEKHAAASNVNFELIKGNDAIFMIVDDDGKGFYPHKYGRRVRRRTNCGEGLMNVKYRVEKLLNGRLKVESQIGKGTTVTLEVPVAIASETNGEKL